MRRKKDSLVPLEKQIIEIAKTINGEFYGYQITDKFKSGKMIQQRGTLYRALNRLEKFGYLTSRWEVKTQGHKPAKKFYELTGKEIK
jgi:DNA-binding PadR family transcriptional regulator